jgi:hypothetical protein
MWDGDRVVGHEVRREPEYSPLDVRMLLAQLVWERSLDENGIPFDEATDPQAAKRDGEFFFRAGIPVENPQTHVVSNAPLINYATKAREDALDALRKAEPEGNLNGMFFPVVKVLRASERR